MVRFQQSRQSRLRLHDRVVDALGVARPHLLQQLQDAVPADAVVRVGDHPQVGEHVLDVGRLDEFEPADLDERDALAGELDLEVERVKGRAEQHGRVLQPAAGAQRRFHPIHDVARLGVLVLRLDRQRQLPAGAAGEEVLGVLLPRLFDHDVGEIQDRLGAAVVLLQADDARTREELREVDDVAEVGAAEGVDALRVVPDDQDVPVGVRQVVEDLRLDRVGVLVLVHHEVFVRGGDAPAHVRVVLQQAQEVDEQVVVVHEMVLALA
ncbi:MAG: hypothetical protein MUE48_07800, partial [Desulfobacterales bacterium]|nr:hypothetical protein [Desulfobacterales bacterium]